MTLDLLALLDWLLAVGCTHIAMESTSSYWRPVYNLLEGQFELLVANAYHIKTVPGRKTDVKDASGLPTCSAMACSVAASSPPPRSGTSAT